MQKDLPIFPEFEKLSLAHKDVLQAIANNFPSSDFNFAGLFTWDVGEVVKVSMLNGNLVMRSSDYLTHEMFYSFIGDNKVDETVKTLTEYAKEHGEQAVLRLITESVATKISPEFHNIVEDRDHHDYIHLVTDLIKLEGSNNHSKRNLIHRFEREHGKSSNASELDLSDENIRKQIESVLSSWTSSQAKDAEEIKDEFIAIKKALDHHQILDMKAFGVYHGHDLIAFALFEILPGKIAVGHFEKADTNFKGVFEHLNHSLAKHLATLGVESINVEQDLGIDSLRRSKESYHPTTFIKKYTVERIK